MPATELNLSRVPEVESRWNPGQILESIEVVRVAMRRHSLMRLLNGTTLRRNQGARFANL
jgi:hypothetical protein